MHAFAITTAAFASLLFANAITIESPTSSDTWSSSDTSQTVSWEAVDTDATSFIVELVNQSGFLSDSPVTLIANQSTGDANTVNSATVTYSGGTWPTGTAFQINLVSANNAILAQSNQFNITAGTSSSSTSASASSSTSSSSGSSSSGSTTSSGIAAATLTTSTSATSAAVTTVTSSGSASVSDIPNSSTTTASTSSGGDTVYKPSAFISLLIGAAGLMGVYL